MKCCHCKKKLPLTAFSSSHIKRPHGKQCRACVSAYHRAYYPTAVSRGLLEKQHKRQKEAAAFLAEVKNKPCMDCKRTFPHYCMDFDHRDGRLKREKISNMRTYSRKNILREIAKCDVVCATCHRIRSARRAAYD